MKLFGKKKSVNNTIKNPITGIVKDISEATDEVFAKKMMGEGVIIIPSSGELYSPVDGEISMIFPTKHAVGIRLANGAALLIHFGVDTVALNGEGFDLKVKQNQKVNQGDLLLVANLDIIRAKAKSDEVVIAISELPAQAHVEVTTGEYDALSKEIMKIID